jgi:hypothetical protein
MIRTLIKSNNNVVSFPIPDKYIGKQLEIIAFAVEEGSEEIDFSSKKLKTFSAIKLNTKGFKFNREQANER